MGLLFMCIVLLISGIVFIYRFYYIKERLEVSKFITLVFLFVVSICLLIISPRLFSLLLGWDGLGLVSYCLVIFYYNKKSNLSGLVTVLTNRFGDALIILRIVIILNYRTLNFFYQDLFYSYNLIHIFIFLGAITKSAQIPFSAWLPAAIAAPTPVSSLVHSSTLVTAGVYILIRLSPGLSFTISNMIFFFSLITSLIAGVSALGETDFKKIIALSTLSQLGVIIIVLRLGNYIFSFFHLITHALFKRLLFLAAGVVIHSSGGNQDLRKLGGSYKSIPYTRRILLIANLSLMGLPFLAGFYSKDILVELFLGELSNTFISLLIIFTLFLTRIYRLRLIYYGLGSNLQKIILFEESYRVEFSTFILRISGVVGGSLVIWCFISEPQRILSLEEKLFLFFLVFVIIHILFIINNYYPLIKKEFLTLKNFIIIMWNLQYITNFYRSSILLEESKTTLKLRDLGWTETTGPFFIKLIILNIRKTINVDQLKITFFILLIIVFFIVLYSSYLNKSLLLKIIL